MSKYKDASKSMPKRAYYVWSGELHFKLLARTEWEACLLAFQRLSKKTTVDPYYVRVNERGFESIHTAQFDTDRLLKAAGYMK